MPFAALDIGVGKLQHLCGRSTLRSSSFSCSRCPDVTVVIGHDVADSSLQGSLPKGKEDAGEKSIDGRQTSGASTANG
jgi:hypothetical protein